MIWKRKVLFNSVMCVYVGFWILAAKFEFEDMNDMETARCVLHQGLRSNPHSKKLWLEVQELFKEGVLPIVVNLDWVLQFHFYLFPLVLSDGATIHWQGVYWERENEKQNDLNLFVKCSCAREEQFWGWTSLKMKWVLTCGDFQWEWVVNKQFLHGNRSFWFAKINRAWLVAGKVSQLPDNLHIYCVNFTSHYD